MDCSIHASSPPSCGIYLPALSILTDRRMRSTSRIISCHGCLVYAQNRAVRECTAQPSAVSNLRVEDREVAMVVSRARGVCVKRVVGGGGGGGGGGKGCVQAGVAAGFMRERDYHASNAMVRNLAKV